MKYVMGSMTSQLSSQNVSLKQTAQTAMTPAKPPQRSMFDLLHITLVVKNVSSSCTLECEPIYAAGGLLTINTI